MRCASAIGVHNDLTSSEAGISSRSSDNKSSGRVHEIGDLTRTKLLRDHLFDDLRCNGISKLIDLDES